MSVFERISIEIEELKSIPGFEVLHSQSHLDSSYSDHKKDRHEAVVNLAGVKCPSSILEAAQINGKLGMHWKHAGTSGEDISGEFILRSSLSFVTRSRLDEAFFDVLYDGLDLRNTRTIDYSGYSGKGIHALMEVRGDELVDEVILFDGYDVRRMGLTYAEYVEMVRRTRGIDYWQFLFCGGVDPKGARVGYIEEGLGLLARTFTSEDYSDLFDRLKRLKA